jgi:ketosteroid isomerase-like protein
MPILFKFVKLFFGLLLSILPVIGAEESALRSLVEAEQKFARAATEHGIRESFLQFFADDSIIFAPDPKNGKQFYTKYEDKGHQLVWRPIFATIASSAELGVTTGPWEMRKSATDETPIAFGQFVSVWKKQGDNSWKMIVDVGIDHPQPTESPGEAQLSLPDAVSGTPAELENKEQVFTNALRADAAAAVLASASDGIRVLRENSFPAVGKAAAKPILASEHDEVTRKVSGGGMSASHDLAYRYGSYARGRGNAIEPGYYLTIWQTDHNRDWKIIVDLQKQAPPPEKK